MDKIVAPRTNQSKITMGFGNYKGNSSNTNNTNPTSNDSNSTHAKRKLKGEKNKQELGVLVGEFSNQQEDAMKRLSFLHKMAQATQEIGVGGSSPLTSFLLSELREVAHASEISIAKKVEETMCDYCSAFLIPGKTCTTRVVSKKRFTKNVKGKLHRKMMLDKNDEPTPIASTVQVAKRKSFRLPKNAILKRCLLCKHTTVLPGLMTSLKQKDQSQAKKVKPKKSNAAIPTTTTTTTTVTRNPVSQRQPQPQRHENPSQSQQQAKNIKGQKKEERLPTSLKEMVQRESSSKKQNYGNTKNLASLKNFLGSI
eukprot:TRINITY_DN845_c0_g1_i4.p1 TRINITY_DN845_c0_g1~~TRINITY_DN845_c0_g1_i4.p1  ORF type:complete len:311 (-),score=62.53 TRINITY_DN845_c0_g1_i4:298-1230(-)